MIELSGGSVAAGVGFCRGSDRLIFQGKRYPLEVSGFSLVSGGVDDYSAAGSDIDSANVAASAGATVAGDAGATTMNNLNGVTIRMTSARAAIRSGIPKATDF